MEGYHGTNALARVLELGLRVDMCRGNAPCRHICFSETPELAAAFVRGAEEGKPLNPAADCGIVVVEKLEEFGITEFVGGEARSHEDIPPERVRPYEGAPVPSLDGHVDPATAYPPVNNHPHCWPFLSTGRAALAEQEQKEAEELASNLGALGWQVGVGAGLWARAARDALTLHDEARSVSRRDREGHERLYAHAYVAVIAVDLVLTFERRLRKLTGDADLQKARAAFDARGPDAGALRDLVAHLDEYAVGTGLRQLGKREPPIADAQVSPLIYWTDDGRTYLSLGGEQVELHAVVDAAVALAEVVERVRETHLVRASSRANAALKRRFDAGS